MLEYVDTVDIILSRSSLESIQRSVKLRGPESAAYTADVNRGLDCAGYDAVDTLLSRSSSDSIHCSAKLRAPEGGGYTAEVKLSLESLSLSATRSENLKLEEGSARVMIILGAGGETISEFGTRGCSFVIRCSEPDIQISSIFGLVLELASKSVLDDQFSARSSGFGE